MNDNKDIYILGVGRNTEVYIDLAESCGYSPVGLFHFNKERLGEFIHDVKIIGSNETLFKNSSLIGQKFAISVGNNYVRSQLANEIIKRGGCLPNLIHPAAIVSKYAILGKGVIIHPNAVIQAGASIGFNSVISFNAAISHTSEVGDNCYLALYANIGAYVKISNFVLIGQGATIVSAKVKYIGENSIIGAGSVVIHDVEANSVVAGNPAKLLRIINPLSDTM